MNTFIWIGILFCISQSAMFSGLNLAFFSISKLKLEIEVKNNNSHALKIAKLREDSNFLLTTILWGNVGINVLLTLLSNSVNFIIKNGPAGTRTPDQLIMSQLL